MNMTAATLSTQAAMILGERTDALVELRAVHPTLTPRQVRRDWFALDELDRLERTAATLGRSFNVWIGAAPRRRRGGEREDVAPSVTSWADCDTSTACAALRTFRPRPTLVVRTSALEGERLQAWWWLDRPIGIDELEAVNRRIAAALRSDRSVCDAPRVLRALGTRNLKRSEPEPIEAIYMTGEVHDLDALLQALPEALESACAREPWRMPASGLTPVGERYFIVRGLVGLLSDRGVPAAALMAMAEAFLEHGCAEDPAKPIELEPVRDLVRTFTRVDRAAIERLRADWWSRAPEQKDTHA
jgi:hypothetical protein